MGLRSSHTAEISLDECEVPVANRLGEEGQGLKVALEGLDGGRIGIASQAVGMAQGAMEASVKYAKQRKAFGQSISEFQAIQWMIADMQTEIEAARCLVHQAAWARDHKNPRSGPIAARAKLYASEMVNRVVYKAVQVHGSAGYSRESDVERMYRDARVISIYEGTSEIQRIVIARDLLGAAAGEGSSGRIQKKASSRTPPLLRKDGAPRVKGSGESGLGEVGKKRRVLSGMRPTGRLHIGNYFGALQNWVKLQDDPSNECFFFIADWHSLTSDYADTSQIAQNPLN